VKADTLAARAASTIVAAIIAMTAAVASLHAQNAGGVGLGAEGSLLHVRRLDLSGEIAADRIGTSVGPRTTLRLESNVYAPIGNQLLWLGVAGEQAREVDSIPLLPLMQAGVRRTFRAIGMSLVATTHAARLGGIAPTMHLFPEKTFAQPGTIVHQETTYTGGASSRLRLWSDIEGAASWRAGRAVFDATLGARRSVASYPSAMWGRFASTISLSTHSALVVSVGTQPAQLALGVPPARIASIAIAALPGSRHAVLDRVPPGPAFTVRAISSDSCVLSLRHSTAHRVELSGDFDAWQAIDLVESQHGVWTAMLALHPGTYHMNLRVDGGPWQAPPGTVVVDDEFNGTVGIVVVR